MTNDAQVLADACRRKLGDPTTYSMSERYGYPSSLALCIVDSVQSTGVRYASVEHVIARYRKYREDQGGDANADGGTDLLRSFGDLTDDAAWAAKIGNGHKTSTQRGAPLKATAVRLVTEAMLGVGVDTCADLRAAVTVDSRRDEVRAVWTGVVGQRSGITWRYVQMLAGVPGVKPDRMILRFVADSLDRPRRSIKIEFAVDVVTEAARLLQVPLTVLDHEVWKHQRARR